VCHSSGQLQHVVLQFPHQKHVLEGIHHFKELPDGIAGVIPIIFRFLSQIQNGQAKTS
jgi:hypothetical protein